MQLALAPPPFAGKIAQRALRIDVLLEPAKEVGGDVVDHFKLGDGPWCWRSATCPTRAPAPP